MAIEARNVTKRFGDFVALDDVSIDVESGSLTALLGPSGSGKSTLLRVIAGLEVADSGDVFISGKEATALAPQKRGVGFVFQHYAPFKHMTVWDNVAFGLQIRQRPKAEIARAGRASCSSSCSSAGSASAIRRSSRAASGSAWRSRARSRRSRRCCCSTSRSARSTRACAWSCAQWLLRLHDEMHVTTIFVTHDQEEALELADSIVVMNKGRVEQIGAAAPALRRAGERVRDELRRPGQQARRRVGAPARRRARPRAERLDARGAGRADRAARLRDAGRARPRRRRAALRAADARRGRRARARRRATSCTCARARTQAAEAYLVSSGRQPS